MTNELKNKIKNELYKAFAHCGETENEILADKVENELDTLLCVMAGTDPQTIQTDNGALIGYIVDIAVTDGPAKDEVVTLQMVIAKNDIKYIINSYTVIKSEAWEPGDKIQIENELNRVVKLTDVDPVIFR
jgi:hypothetical protein